MKISVIKKLAEEHSLEELHDAEQALYNEETPAIPVEGDDEGERLTHVLAAVFVKEYMADNNASMNEALRAFSLKVRTSIS